MKKLGSFFFSFVPMLGAIAMQNLGLSFAVGISFIVMFFSGASFADCFKILLDTDYNVCIMLFYGFASAIVYGVWYQYRYEGDLKPKAKILLNPMLLASILLLVPLAQFISSVLAEFCGTLVPSWLEQYESLMDNVGLAEFPSPLMLFYSVIVAPICEEMIFRGLTLRQAKKALPFWAANLLQAVLFGAFHMNWIQGIYAFALGILLGYICEYSGSIYYAMLLHFGFNFYGTIISGILSFIEDEMILGLITIGLIAVSVVFGLPLFVLGILKQRNTLKEEATAIS